MKKNRQKGVSLVITFFVVIIILSVVLTIVANLYSETKITRNAGNLITSYYAAESGIEKVSYYDRNIIPSGMPSGTTRGVCYMCDPINPSCPDCTNCSRSGTNCASDNCTNCTVTFSTDLIGSGGSKESYDIKAVVLPNEEDLELTELTIEATGSYEDAKRAISMSSIRESEGGGGDGGGDLWLTGWSYRKKITIDNAYVDADLTDFPVYVKVSADVQIGDGAQNDGDDIRFTSSDGSTLLKYEEESWSGGAGADATADYWVKVPTVATAADTDIYIYYGKADASDGQDAANVWDANFKGVWHLPNGTTLSALDSTSNNNDGTIIGARAGAGKIDGAASANKHDDRIRINNTTIPTGNKLTIGAWINLSDDKYYFLFSRSSVNLFHLFGSYVYFFLATGKGYDGHQQAYNSAFAVDGAWHYVVGTYDGSMMMVYVDGAAGPATVVSGNISESDGQTEIGEIQGNPNPTNAFIDEARVSDINRSPAWIKFEYRNIVELDNELSWGGVETLVGGEQQSWACGDNLTDPRDGKIYSTVLIGGQCWMRQNINVGTMTAGTNNQGDNCPTASAIEKYCYDNNEANCSTYGGLYQWNQTMCGAASCNGTGESQPACATPVQGICPAGWHIPSHYEYNLLERAVCTSGTCATDFPYDTTTEGSRGTNEGISLQTVDSTHFSGLLAGARSGAGTFINLPYQAIFWSSLQSSTYNAWFHGLSIDYGKVDRGHSGGYKDYGSSVRCLRDTTNTAPTFTAGPSDGSSSTATPTISGNNVTFTATATDSQSNNYYLAICKTNTVTAHNGAAPTCNSANWCISGPTTSGAQATCAYTTSGSDIESQTWYAFVCDGNASGAACSASSQGSGNTGSPFVVAAPVACDPLTDPRDGKTYSTVLIGSQCWTRQNMNVGTMTAGTNNQGTDCPSASAIEKYCYDNNEANCSTYGGLYQLDQTMCGAAGCNGTGESQPACTTPVQGICPAGWHIPSHYEYNLLERAVCTSGTCVTDFPYDTTTDGWRGTNEGTTLKTVDSTHFSGLMAGEGGPGGFRLVGIYTNFWTSLRFGSAAWSRHLFLYWGGVIRGGSAKDYGFSVRCLKD